MKSVLKFMISIFKPIKGPFEGPGSTEWGPKRGSELMRYLKVQAAHYGIVIGEYPTTIIRKTLVVLMVRWDYSKGLVLF